MFWKNIQDGLQEKFKKYPTLENFLEWPEIVSTMVVKASRWIIPEENALMGHPLERVRWEYVTDPEYGGYSNANLIHQAYHLARWERHTGLHVADLDSIVEIGGGYGAMALIVRRSGFKGTYQIFDLPELCQIQEFYFKKMGVEVSTSPVFKPSKADLMIGLFSLSEMDVVTQAGFVDNVESKHELIGALNAPWEGYNTLPDLQRRYQKADLVQIPHLDGRVYLLE